MDGVNGALVGETSAVRRLQQVPKGTRVSYRDKPDESSYDFLFRAALVESGRDKKGTGASSVPRDLFVFSIAGARHVFSTNTTGIHMTQIRSGVLDKKNAYTPRIMIRGA